MKEGNEWGCYIPESQEKESCSEAEVDDSYSNEDVGGNVLVKEVLVVNCRI